MILHARIHHTNPTPETSHTVVTLSDLDLLAVLADKYARHPQRRVEAGPVMVGLALSGEPMIETVTVGYVAPLVPWSAGRR